MGISETGATAMNSQDSANHHLVEVMASESFRNDVIEKLNVVREPCMANRWKLKAAKNQFEL